MPEIKYDEEWVRRNTGYPTFVASAVSLPHCRDCVCLAVTKDDGRFYVDLITRGGNHIDFAGYDTLEEAMAHYMRELAKSDKPPTHP